ncbi:MAG TPA: 8-amino-7-oxononanoate synthase [Marinagarivorans sp.]
MTLETQLQARLAERQAAQLYRQRATVSAKCGMAQEVAGHPLINFCSNDYLGLSSHPSLIRAAQHVLDSFGFGSGASHLVSGHSHFHHQLEQALAHATQRPRALLFSTGYMANLALVTALAPRSGAVIGDKLNHASLVDAGQLASAQNPKTEFLRYKHCQLKDLERLLNKVPAGALVVTDGVFSMDGNIAPLADLAALCRDYQATLAVDDAHGFGCLGDQGGGSVLAAGLSVDDVPVYMGTLGKAVGGFGAFVAGSESLIEALIQFARPYVYTTALPPAIAAGNLASLELLQHDVSFIATLNANIAYFRQRAEALLASDGSVTLLPSQTAIQPVILASETRVLAVAAALRSAGYWVGAIRPPTVPAGTARLRITLSAAHTKRQIDGLLSALTMALKAEAGAGV